MRKSIFILFIIFSIPVFAQNNVNINVGDKAILFSGKTVNGEEIELNKLLEENPVVFVMLRGWPGYQCPICTRQVGSLIADAEEFQKSGASVLMVYPGPAEQLIEHAREFSEDFDFPENYHFILDPDYSITNKYGLRWDEPKETAYPSTFVINKNGQIVFAKISTSHGGRAENENVLSALNQLQ